LIVSSLTRLTNADDFSSVFILKKRFSGQFINIFHKPNQLEYNRFGLIVSKKINKKAVARNYMKRVIRDVFRKLNNSSKLDIIIQVKKNFHKKDYALVKNDIHIFLEKHAK
jgi:ribonuclease P protein component